MGEPTLEAEDTLLEAQNAPNWATVTIPQGMCCRSQYYEGSSVRSFVCSPVLIKGWSRCWQRFLWSG